MIRRVGQILIVVVGLVVCGWLVSLGNPVDPNLYPGGYPSP